jgi:SAM-dependent methyltransferase
MSDGEDPFEEIYARAGEDLDAIPWASLTPSPALVSWLDSGRAPSPAAGARALVVGCGLGDDVEELSGRGWRVTGFDVSPTAIDRCRVRFPASAADYVVADLFALPDDWARAFGLLVEIRTLQSLPVDVRAAAVDAIAGTVAPGGEVYVHCFGRAPAEPLGRRPWPVSHDELAQFERAGLAGHSFEESLEPGGRRFTAVYGRR